MNQKKEDKTQKTKKNRNRDLASSFLALSIYLLILLKQISFTTSLQTHMISFYEKGSNPVLKIDQDSIPETFKAITIFSIVCEFKIIFKSQASLSHTIDIFKWKETDNFFTITSGTSIPPLSFTLDSQSITEPFLELNTKKFNDMQYQTINLVFDFELGSAIRANLVSFSADSLEAIPQAKKQLWESASFDPSGDAFFYLNLAETADFELQIRQLYLIDRVFSDSDFEIKNMYKGVASLYQAIYLYMEPTYSKLLFNRSRFSFPPATSGNFDDSFFDLPSAYNANSNRTNWMLLNFAKEFVELELSSIQTIRPDSVSVVVNFELHLWSLESDYINGKLASQYQILDVVDSTDVTIFKIMLALTSYDDFNGIINYKFIVANSSDSALAEILFEDSADPTIAISPESIMFSIFALDDFQICVQVEINSKEYQPNPLVKMVNLPYPLNSVHRVILGSNSTTLLAKNPIFLVLFYDIQVFHGGYYITFNEDRADLRAFSRQTTEMVYCRGNPYTSRYTGNPQMELVREEVLRSASNCTQTGLNGNCSLADCLICGQTECLACIPTFDLVAGACVKVDEDEFTFNFFSKRILDENNVFDQYMYGSFSTKINLQNTKIYFAKTGYNFENYSSSFDLKRVQTDLIDSFYMVNFNNMDPDLKLNFFGGDASFFRFIFLNNMQSNLSGLQIDSDKLFVNLNSFIDLCNLPNNFFKGGFALFLCSQYADFSQFDYYPNVSATAPVGNDSVYLFDKTQRLPNMIFGCNNNCACNSSSPNECSSCKDTQYEVVYSVEPLVNACFDCSQYCGDCQQGLCLSCLENTSFDDGGKKNAFGVSSKYKNCQPCHQDCDKGCTGPTPADCISETTPAEPQEPDLSPDTFSSEGCKFPCTLCDKKGNCKQCAFYPLNLIFEYKHETNNLEISDLIFCDSCSANCRACSSKDSCSCVEKPNSPFVSFDDQFNICKNSDCPSHCQKCDKNSECVKCKDSHLLVENECISLGVLTKTCHKAKEDRCLECPPHRFKRNLVSCSLCSSNCAVCDSIANQGLCAKCKSDFLLSESNFCFRLSENPIRHSIWKYSNLLANSGFLPSNQKLTILPKSPFCTRSKNDFTSLCSECAPFHYLSSDSFCQKCPPNSRSCKLVLGKLTITRCDDHFYIDKSVQKCIPCGANCLFCDHFGCSQCSPNFKLVNKRCVLCADPNCEICLHSSSCFRCFPGYVFSPRKSKCVRCPLNCKICSSESTCLKCDSRYQLTRESLCQVECLPGLRYRDPHSQQCISCDKCQFCSSPFGSPCSSCDLCQRKCVLLFTKESSLVYVLSSVDIEFPETSKLAVSYISEVNPPVQYASTRNAIKFEFFPDNYEAMALQSVVHKHSLYLKQCSLSSDVSLKFSIPSSEMFFFIKNGKTILSTIKVFKHVIESTVILASVAGSTSTELNSIILLLNLNELFSYSYIYAPPTSGFSLYFYKVFRIENFDFSIFSPFSEIENIYSVAYSNEINIKAVQIYSYEFFLYLVIFALFCYFSYFYQSRATEKLAEIAPNCKLEDLSEQDLQYFVLQLEASLPNSDFLDLKSHLHRLSKRRKIGKCEIWLRKFFNHVFLKKNILIFYIFQTLCIDLVHLSIKSFKLMTTIQPTYSLMFLCLFFHFLLLFFIFQIFLIYFELHKNVAFYLKQHRKDKIKEYICITANLPILMLTICYIYTLLLLSNKIPHQSVLNISIFLFILYVLFQKRIDIIPPSWNTMRMIGNIPILLALNFSTQVGIHDQSFFFDFLFIFVNGFKIIFIIFEQILKINVKTMQNLQKKVKKQYRLSG